ncbi:MAG: hypothetical protein EPO22_03725 [Dehalococcoidia bacterium]|nr:MAG: hypothetical protein EPO22_03725 [Dehalococcoidia bacterium]
MLTIIRQSASLRTCAASYWLPLVVVVMLSLACSDARNQPEGRSPTTGSAGTATAVTEDAEKQPGDGSPTAAPVKVAALIATTTQASFEVEFEWDHGRTGHPKTNFSWRQDVDIRRFDAEVTNDTGSLFIETGFLDAEAGTHKIGCDWYWPPSAEEIRIACVAQATALPGILTDALDTALQVGRVQATTRGREIAGFQAMCYVFEAVAPGEICTDGSGVPLYFKGAFSKGDLVQTIVATKVSRNVSGPLMPTGLPFTNVPFKTGPSYPLSNLNLPSWNN